MNTTNAAVATGVIVTTGRLASGKGLDTKVVVGAAATALFLAGINEASPDLAGKFATAIVIIALFMYAPAIFWKLGLIKSKPGDWK